MFPETEDAMLLLAQMGERYGRAYEAQVRSRAIRYAQESTRRIMITDDVLRAENRLAALGVLRATS